MQTSEKKRRRRHSGVFKAEAVAACRVPGASTAGVALERQINANLLRRWVKETAGKMAVSASGPAFLPVAISAPKPHSPPERPIRVQVRRRGLRVTIQWPTMAADHCASWLKELLG